MGTGAAFKVLQNESCLLQGCTFNLIVPIFKGRPAEEIEVEIIADVDGRNIRLSLCSPGAEVIVEEERNKAIDEQLLLIRKLAPDIAIIEQ